MWPSQKNNKKEGFGYSSPEVQKKSAIKLLVTEAIILFVAIIGIFVLLNYLGILSLYKISPTFFGWVPHRDVVTNNFSNTVPAGRDNKSGTKPLPPVETSQKVPDYSIAPSIGIVSDIPGYTVSIINENKLIELLKGWGLYGVSYSDPNAGSTNGKPLSTITIHLTSKEQETFKLNDAQGVYVGTAYQLNNENLNLLIYLAPRILSDKKSANFLLNNQTLLSLRVLAGHANSVEKYTSASDEVGAIVKGQKLNNSYYFAIK